MVENFENTNDDIKRKEGTGTIETKKTDPEFNNSEVIRTIGNISPDAIKSINFGYENYINNTDFILNLNNKFEGDNSLTGVVAHNEQIQLLLDDILSNYGNYVKQDETSLKKIIQKKNNYNSEKGEMVECFEEYLLNNDSEEGFEQFLLSNGCISGVLLSYFQTHINEDVNGFNTNLISKNNIKAKIKAEWHKKLYMDYNEKYGLKLGDKMIQLRDICNFIKSTVDNLASLYLNGSGDNKFLESLEGFIIKTKDNEDFKEVIKSDHFNFLLRNSIKEYSRLLDIENENRTLRKTDDKVFDTQLRIYLFLYGRIFYPDVFEYDGGTLDNYEGNLGNILEAILVADGKLDKAEDNGGENKYIQAEEIFQNGLKNRERSMRHNARRLRRLNNSSNDDEKQLLNNAEKKDLDIQNASGVEIAQEMNLGKSLTGFKMKEIQSDADIIFRKKIAYRKTCNDFLAKNGKNLRSFGLRISDFFSLNNNFNLLVNYKKLDELKGKLSDSEINKVRILITVFISEFNNNLEEIEQKMDDKKEAVHNIVKEYAIGAVIDNIKDMFQSIVRSSNEGDFQSGFEFNEKESAKIEGNNLILSGTFNGEPLFIRYNLSDGTLFMNSYISEISNDTMVIGDNTPKQKIGELRPFQDILDTFYESPTESMSNDVLSRVRRIPQPQPGSKQNLNNGDSRPRRFYRRNREVRKHMREEHKHKLQQICGTKLDEINEKAKNQTESRTTKNYAVSNLLKSLNIMPEDNNLRKTINLKTNSDLYKAVQTIINSESNDVNYFSNYLGKLMNCIGLKWGKNSLLGQDKTTEDAKLIFDNNNSGETVKYLKGKTENFNYEYNRMWGKQVFDSGTTFGIMDVINEKFVEGTPPNGQLKIDKIEDFDKDLTKDLKNYKQLSEQQKEIETSKTIIEAHNKQTKKEEKDADEFLENQLSSLI